ncbi:salicylate synthase [Streptomyces sp. NPDC050095]|uniref:salicylate synthase n=1 Tax=unclassified Streptomyces TaxID=2593676 RepID=UPI0034430DE4
MTDDALRYEEVRLPASPDPLSAVARLARSGLFQPYVAYEGPGTWYFAGGTLASLRLTRDHLVTWTKGRAVRQQPCPGSPLDGVREFLATLPGPDWRAYGWTAFELAYLLAGVRDGLPDSELLHLMVPETEVRFTPQATVLRCTDAGLAGPVADLVLGHTGSDTVPDDRVGLEVADGHNYRAAVAAAVLEIRSHALEKVILSRTVEAPAPVDLVASYVAGRRTHAPARSFLLDLGRMCAAGFSPETVVVVSPDGQVTTQPLAGTRARTGHADTDRRLRGELRTDPKEVHEHAISVRLAWDELASVCAPGTVRVAPFMTVRERGSVQHLASTVSGTLHEGKDRWDAFAALFPAVTATGIPKAPAYDLIRQLEGEARALYSGTVLTCDSQGGLDATLVLRSIFQRGGRTWLRAGAGIVAQSLPEREHEETCEKLLSVAQCLVPSQTAEPAPSGYAPDPKAHTRATK